MKEDYRLKLRFFRKREKPRDLKMERACEE